MKKKTKTIKTAKKKMKLGASLVAAGAAAAVAGYYFYASKNAKNHRKIAAKWATDLKKEVIKETKRLKNISPKSYADVVDRITRAYGAARSVDTKALKNAAKELKANWATIKREAINPKK